MLRWLQKALGGRPEPSLSDVLTTYSTFMIEQPLSIMDVAMLPMPKTQMKTMFKIIYANASDAKAQATIEFAYMFLSHFQDGVGPTPIDGKVITGGDVTANIKANLKILEKWMPWEKLSLAETEILLDEWKRFRATQRTGGNADVNSDAHHSVRAKTEQSLSEINSAVGELGDTYASMGNMCIGKEDYAGAASMYLLAATKGNAQAQSQLGRLYTAGLGVPRDYAEAVRWSRLAAEQGETNAEAHLGDLYVKGYGVPVNYEEAAKWCRKAAEKGNATAQLLLGSLYNNGQGVARDYVQSYVLLSLAASGFSSANADMATKATSIRDYVGAKLTKNEIASAQDAIRAWKPQLN